MNFVRTETQKPRKGLVFLLQPFGTKDGFPWDTHHAFLKRAIEAEGMTCMRADDIYGSQPIMANVWKGIVEAEVVIADLTGRNPNVLYELGLAHLIGKPVIMIVQDPEDIPVDLRGLMFIQYSASGPTYTMLAEELVRHIKATRARPHVEYATTPITDDMVEEVEGMVDSVTPDLAIIRLKDGRVAILKAADWNWQAKRVDLTGEAIARGDKITGYYESSKGENLFSPKDPRTNPWRVIESEYMPGTEFRGRVFSDLSYGVFIEVHDRLNGLIPRAKLPHDTSYNRDDVVTARIVAIRKEAREIELELVSGEGNKLAPAEASGAPPAVAVPEIEVGTRTEGTICKLFLAKGFVLLDTSLRKRPLLLHINSMSEETRKRAEADELNVGEKLELEVMSSRGDNVAVIDIPREDDQ